MQESAFVITPCQPGTLPPGGVGDYGIFVKHLVRHIKVICRAAMRGCAVGIAKLIDIPGVCPVCQERVVDIGVILTRVTRGVFDDSKGFQKPFQNSFIASAEVPCLTAAAPFAPGTSSMETLTLSTLA